MFRNHIIRDKKSWYLASLKRKTLGIVDKIISSLSAKRIIPPMQLNFISGYSGQLQNGGGLF
jgi:hypothetical protein